MRLPWLLPLSIPIISNVLRKTSFAAAAPTSTRPSLNYPQNQPHSTSFDGEAVKSPESAKDRCSYMLCIILFGEIIPFGPPTSTIRAAVNEVGEVLSTNLATFSNELDETTVLGLAKSRRSNLELHLPSNPGVPALSTSSDLLADHRATSDARHVLVATKALGRGVSHVAVVCASSSLVVALADSALTRHLLNRSVGNLTVGPTRNREVKDTASMLSIGPSTSAISSIPAVMNSPTGLKPLWTPCSRTLLVLYSQSRLRSRLFLRRLVDTLNLVCYSRTILPSSSWTGTRSLVLLGRPGLSILPSTLGLAKVYRIYLYWALVNYYVPRNCSQNLSSSELR